MLFNLIEPENIELSDRLKHDFHALNKVLKFIINVPSPLSTGQNRCEILKRNNSRIPGQIKFNDVS